MILFIVLASVAAYTVADLFAARYLYGRMRAHGIDKDGPERFNEVDRPFVKLGALLLAFAWPVSLLCLGVARFMDTTPVRSQHEIKAEADAMTRYIRELEKELKL